MAVTFFFFFFLLLCEGFSTHFSVPSSATTYAHHPRLLISPPYEIFNSK